MRFSYYILILTLFCSTAKANISCLSIFNAQPIDKPDPTSIFITYLGNLFEENVIYPNDLIRFKEDLQNGILTNPIENSKAEVNTVLLIHRDGFNDLLIYDSVIDRDRILKWLIHVIAEEQNRAKQFDLAFKKTAYTFQPILFHPIKLPDNDSNPKYIELMSTPVTQYHWVKRMGKNPSRFFNGRYSQRLKMNGILVQLQPNHPIEKVNLYSAMMFANILSREKGFHPFYPFEDFLTTLDLKYAANGTLEFKINADEKLRLFKGKFHEGYRLPSYEEQSLIKAIVDRKFIDNEDKIFRHEWLGENSNNQTQEVATLDPIFIQNHPFYDLRGNVSEWNINSTITDEYIYLFFGDYSNSNTLKDSKFVGRHFPTGRYHNVGFRLVRDITEEEYRERLE